MGMFRLYREYTSTYISICLGIISEFMLMDIFRGMFGLYISVFASIRDKDKVYSNVPDKLVCKLLYKP